MDDSSLGIHKDIQIRLGTIGSEQQPLILVDNFVDTPERLIDIAASDHALAATRDLYPGVRASMPPAYLNLIQDSLGELICQTFTLRPESIKGAESFLSIVATPPHQLHKLQRMPHMDGTNPDDIAFLHYLCGGTYGGTSFYRHTATGYEYIDGQRYSHYLSTLEQQIAETGLPEPPQYMNGSNDLFEQVASLEAKFNRLIIYRGTSLHSGDIGADYSFDTNPRTGRLTATSFLYSGR